VRPVLFISLRGMGYANVKFPDGEVNKHDFTAIL
jgi:hypothetical protein